MDNVKSDRTAEDLLFQVMLELGATLDSKIATEVVAGKTIYNVAFWRIKWSNFDVIKHLFLYKNSEYNNYFIVNTC